VSAHYIKTARHIFYGCCTAAASKNTRDFRIFKDRQRPTSDFSNNRRTSRQSCPGAMFRLARAIARHGQTLQDN
jgi:hypothetical protein